MHSFYFIHVTAVLGLCAALAFELLSLFHLRRASSLTEANGSFRFQACPWSR